MGTTRLLATASPGLADQRHRRPISSPSVSLKDLRTDATPSASQINGDATHAISASVTGMESTAAADLPVAVVVGTSSTACQANTNQNGVVSSSGTSSSRAFPLSLSTSALDQFGPQSDSGCVQPGSDEVNKGAPRPTDEQFDERLVVFPTTPSQHTQMRRARSGTAAPAMPAMRPPMLHQISSLRVHTTPRLQLQPQHHRNVRPLHEQLSSSGELSHLPLAQVRHTAETDQPPFNSDNHPRSPSWTPSAGNMRRSRSGGSVAGRSVAGSSGKRHGRSLERVASRSPSATAPLLPTQGALHGAKRGSDRGSPSAAANSQRSAPKLNGARSTPSSRPSSPRRPSTPSRATSPQAKQRRPLDPSGLADSSTAAGSRPATSRVPYVWR